MSGTANASEVIGRLDTEPVDFNKLYGQYLGTQRQQLELQNARAHQAVGRAAQQATGPDGTVDQNKLRALLAQTPEAGPAMLSAIGTSQDQQGVAQTQARAGGAHAARLAFGFNAMTDAELNDSGGAKLLAGVRAAVDAGEIAPAAYQKLAGMIKPTDGAATIRPLLNRVLAGAISGPEGIGFYLGGQDLRPNGQTDQPGVRAGLGSGAAQPGAFQPAGQPIQQVTGPGQNAGLVETTIPDPNNPGQYLRVMQPRSALPGASGVAPAPGAPAAPSPMGSGRYPTPAAAPGAAQPGASSGSVPSVPSVPGQAATGAPPGTVLSAPPTGVPERQQADIAAFTAAQADVPRAQRAVQTLQTAQEAMKLARTGPGTERIQKALAFLNVVGIKTLSPNVTDWAIVHKALIDYARQSGQAASSDAQLHAALGSNASTEIDENAALHVIQQEIGRQRQNIAVAAEHGDQTGIGYGAHAARFARETDPRAFAADAYSADELNALTAKMTPAEKSKFYTSLAIAKRRGLIPGAAP